MAERIGRGAIYHSGHGEPRGATRKARNRLLADMALPKRARSADSRYMEVEQIGRASREWMFSARGGAWADGLIVVNRVKAV